ncbi:MAG: GntR family transcriptional regulator [Bacilli bacterium]|nr:GntR family transcriptional regulator [Bacilli bacterium]CDA51869.1 putative GntR family transcriptional regulator [Clostridium sp. CAG:533]
MDAVFNNSVPIYLQIVSEIKKQIVSGKLIPGERIPSVRELALTYKVNPNTMQKALIELEENGLIKTERTNGKFVTEDENIINKIKNDYADNLTQNYLSEMISLGITKQEIKERIK